MATGAGLAEWEQTHGKKKAKCVLTSTGLLMEGVSPPLSWSTIGGTGICDRRVYPELKEFRRAAGGLLRERRADVRRQKENFRLSDLRESGVGPPISWPSTTARQALPTSRANAEAFRPASPIIAIFLPELLAALSREKTVLVRN
jgi:hypothetical protein